MAGMESQITIDDEYYFNQKNRQKKNPSCNIIFTK